MTKTKCDSLATYDDLRARKEHAIALLSDLGVHNTELFDTVIAYCYAENHAPDRQYWLKTVLRGIHRLGTKVLCYVD